MDEGILAAAIRLDESEALLEIEPLHGSRCHGKPFQDKCFARPPWLRAVEIAFSGEKIASWRRNRSAQTTIFRRPSTAVICAAAGANARTPPATIEDMADRAFFHGTPSVAMPR
jgi:hypothetical protein